MTYDALNERDFWYWPQGGAAPTGPGSDRQQIDAYASTGMTCMTLRHPEDADITAWDDCVSAHCAFAVMGIESNP